MREILKSWSKSTRGRKNGNHKGLFHDFKRFQKAQKSLSR